MQSLEENNAHVRSQGFFSKFSFFPKFIVNRSHYDVKKPQKNTEHASINKCMALIGM